MILLFIIFNYCVYLYNIQNFFYFSYQWWFYLDYQYINKYLCFNWFIRIQFYLLTYCKCFIYIWLNVYKKYQIRFLETNGGYYIKLYLNLIFLTRILNRHCLFWNLLFIVIFNQLSTVLYFFQQYFCYNINVYYRWLNILYII